jgi:hypothetical protein
METIMTLRDFANTLSAQITTGKPIPEPDTYNEEISPYGCFSGSSKFGSHTCPTCRKPPTEVNGEKFFLFRDSLSAKEYQISGMCQSCQDKTFGDSDD